MNRRRRTEILIKGSIELARGLVQSLEEKYELRVIEAPNNGLVMIKQRETAKNSSFYLGEVLVTEAKVEIKGTLGLGVVAGNNEELAYLLAVVDAAYNAKLPEIEKWEEVLRSEETKIEAELMQRQGRLMLTKVNFETMQL